MDPMMPALRWCGVLLACGTGWTQSVQVYSEFQRIDPSGSILDVDRAPQPREILSPAVIRGAWASFQAVVTVPGSAPFWVFIGQNPERAVEVTAYRELYVHRGDTEVPDGLEQLAITDTGSIADPGPGSPGANRRVYWLDVRVRPDTPVGRFRLEVQLNVGDKWIIYPLEIRVLSPVLKGTAPPGGSLAAIEAPADATARGPLLAFLCGPGKNGPEGPLTIRRLIRRNARQDMALAHSLEPAVGISTGILKILGAAGDVERWCQAPVFPAGLGAEWYLRVRDYVYRSADRTSGSIARR
jgi:hypothetical protein